MNASANRPIGTGSLRLVALAWLVLLGVAGANAADGKSPPVKSSGDNVHLDTSVIKGNQGLPRYLSIVPWKRSNPGDLRGRPAGSLLDEELAPVDRAEFRREIGYTDELQKSAAEKQAQAASAPPAAQSQTP
jgi:hypothetical protein